MELFPAYLFMGFAAWWCMTLHWSARRRYWKWSLLACLLTLAGPASLLTFLIYVGFEPSTGYHTDSYVSTPSERRFWELLEYSFHSTAITVPLAFVVTMANFFTKRNQLSEKEKPDEPYDY